MKTLSGGQKRRLTSASRSSVIPTSSSWTSRRRASTRLHGEAWELVRSLRALGKTVLLTTHYLEEAQQLADRVAVLVAGEIVRIGKPSDLTGASTMAEIRYRRDGELVVETDEPTRVLNELTAAALAEGRELEGLEVRRPTLEDVYLELVDGGDA